MKLAPLFRMYAADAASRGVSCALDADRVFVRARRSGLGSSARLILGSTTETSCV